MIKYNIYIYIITIIIIRKSSIITQIFFGVFLYNFSLKKFELYHKKGKKSFKIIIIVTKYFQLRKKCKITKIV